MAFFQDFMVIFVKALLPPMVFCGVGAVAERCLEFDRRTLSRFTIYVLFPPLLFMALLNVEVATSEVLRVAAFMVIVLAVMCGLGWCYARRMGMDGRTTSGAVLASGFFNAVNLGFPVALFAFGEEGLMLAGVLVAVNSIPHNALGMLIAARGAMPTRDALRALVRMPFLYTLGLAVLCRLFDYRPPELVLAPVDTLGKAGIPVILVCIGMELARMQVGAVDGRLGGVIALRLLVAPLVAIAAAWMVGLEGLLRSVVILQACMPSAIAPIVYARLFGGNVEFLSRAVFYSTLLSLLTIPILLRILEAGGG